MNLKDPFHNILQNIPVFNHLTLSEIQALCNIAETKFILKDERIDIKKIESFCVIVDGIFELGSRMKGEIVYLSPGSFFGEVPFAKVRHSGSVRAVKDSIIMALAPAEMYKVFLSSYKGARGYFKNIKKNGFEIVDSGNDFLKCRSRVITVFSPYHNSGNSIFSAMLGLILSAHGSTIIVDASLNGNSIFGFFKKDLAPAISQKPAEKASNDKFIYDAIIDSGENLALLNISSGSKIKVNPDILSPAIFILSRKYNYIIIDHSGFEKDFTDRVLGQSDIIFPVIKSIKDKSALYNTFDSALKDGQRVYYILNRFYAKNAGIFEGGYTLEDLGINKNEDIITDIKKHIEGKKPGIFNELAGLITYDRACLVAQTNLANSVFLAGFFSSLYEKDIKIDIYTSSWSYLIAALFALSRDQKEFEKNFLNLFTENSVNSFLDITFPEEHVYKNSKISHFARELAGDNRLEHYNMLPMALLTERQTGERRIFSTGYVRDLFTASFLLDIFEPVRIADAWYYSGFPANYVKPEDLLRTDIADIRCVSVNNKQRLSFGEKKLSGFYKGYIDGLNNYHSVAFPKSENDFFIDADTDKYNPKEILKISKEICKEFKL